MPRLSLITSTLLLATLSLGTRACQEDYEFAPQISPTASPSASPSTTPTPSVSPTASPTVSLSLTPTPTPTPDDEDEALLGSAGGIPLEAVLAELPDEPSTDDARPQPTSLGGGASAALSDGTWLGQIGKRDKRTDEALDSDGDGFTDRLERDVGSDPLDPKSTPAAPVTRLADRMNGVDSDMDGVKDSEERDNQLNVYDRDTDGDGCNDGAEILSGSDPLNPSDLPRDADGDCLSDDYEQRIKTNPGSTDSDNDMLRDDRELALGTDPLNPDTDGDGILDGKEVALGSDPTIAEPSNR